MYNGEDVILRALKAGASAYVLKRAEVAELVKAIRLVARGEAYLDSAVARRVVEGLQKAEVVEERKRGEEGSELTPR
ncbi:hypothetical protein V3F56_10650 [Moorellaceae bacterium AZ2]